MSETETRLKRDKEIAESTWKRNKGVAEAVWKREKETIGDWSRTKTQADSAIKSVREVLKTAQDILNGTRWPGRSVGGTPRPLAIPSGSGFVEQMAVYRSTSELARNEIELLLKDYKPNS
jgi:hypothetical protein